jgi:type VI secretion system protein ImpC
LLSETGIEFVIMAKSWSLRVGNINLTGGIGTGGSPESVPPETPFRILVMGDFSGASRPAGQPPLSQRKPLRVDRDNLEEALARLAPAVQAPLGPNPQEHVAISFREMDDFEPDRLFTCLKVFESLGDLRQRLRNPARFAAAAAEIKQWAADATAPPAPRPAPISSENLLEQILGESAGGSRSIESALLPGGAFGVSDWDRFLKQTVAPHLVAKTDPRLPELEAVVDEAISAQMRTILHHADFQALEAAWRGLFLLTRRLDTGENLQLSLLDVTREELAGDLLNVDDFGNTGTYQQLVERTVGSAGGQPWAVVVGLYTFGSNQQDLELLATMARLARAAGAPFLAAAYSLLLGCPDLASSTDSREWQMDAAAAEAWLELRSRPEAAYLGLSLPRFLLRLPYGKDSHAAEQFAFEEMPPGSSHECYLWGNPAVAGALLLGQSFMESGWHMHAGQHLEIDGLPMHIYKEEGENQQKPCAEMLLRDAVAECILDLGVMPLVSVQGQDAVRLARFQSIASPAAPLAGRWL